jgi:hypothetical protein
MVGWKETNLSQQQSLSFLTSRFAAITQELQQRVREQYRAAGIQQTGRRT